MLSIRLTRIGKKHHPEYRVIICEKARDPWGKALEILGHINPHTSPRKITLKADRIKYWIANGAQCTNTVWNMLIDEKVVEGEKRKSFKISKKRQAKIDEKNAKELEKKKELEEKAKAEAEAKKAEEKAKAEAEAEAKKAAEAEEKAKAEEKSQESDSEKKEESK